MPYFHKKAYKNELNSHRITNNLLISATGLPLPRLVLLVVTLGEVLREAVRLFLLFRFDVRWLPLACPGVLPVCTCQRNKEYKYGSTLPICNTHLFFSFEYSATPFNVSFSEKNLEVHVHGPKFCSAFFVVLQIF